MTPLRQLTVVMTGIVILASAQPFGSRAAATLALQPVVIIDLPGTTSRLDYETLDPKTGLLFIAALGDGAVVVFDTRRRQVVGRISNVAKAHGVLVVPSLGRVYASATGTNELVDIDEKTLAIRSRVNAGVYPDGIAFDPVSRRVFVSDERGGAVRVFDTRRDAKVATIDLGGEAGNTQYDPISRRMFTAEQSHNTLVEIDPATMRITGRYPVEGCSGVHGLFIDAPHRLVFVGCEDNATLAVFDLTHMRVTQRQSVGDTPDVLAFDAAKARLYVASESGIVSIFEERGRSVRKLAESFLAYEAHTVAVDPATHLVYFALQNLGGRPRLEIMNLRW